MKFDRLNVCFHLAAAFISYILTYLFPYFQKKYDHEQALIFGLSFASLVWILICVSIGPLHVLSKGSLPSQNWKRLRGLSGIWASILITAHLFELWKNFYNFSLSQATRGGSWHGYLECGILHAAFFYIVLMGITSNDFSRQVLGPYWKRFHRGIYPLFPAIAAAGVFEMSRIETHWSILLMTGLAGLGIPILQLKARAHIQKRD